MSGAGMGLRSKRFSMIVDDGKVTTLNVETKPGVNESGAAHDSRAALSADLRPELTITVRQRRQPRGFRIIVVGASAALEPPYSATRAFGLNGAMPSRASSSARSFSGWPAWPFTQCQVTLWRFRASSSACHSSAFFTGFLAAVFQPLRFQPSIQPPMPSLT